MPDFEFIQNPLSKKWAILAPRRAKRPDIANGMEPVCPFCPGREADEKELFRISAKEKYQISTPIQSGSNNKFQIKTNNPLDIGNLKLEIRNSNQQSDDWLVRVIPNKFPFAPIHEVIIHSPDHHKNFEELPLDQVELILQTYRHRYNEHAHKGQVYIFHNRGEKAGESLPHPHTQLAVVPFEVKMDIPRLPNVIQNSYNCHPELLPAKPCYAWQAGVSGSQLNRDSDLRQNDTRIVETNHFYLFCPKTSQWPDEVWIAAKERGRAFGEISNEQITDLAFVLSRLIQILNLRHGHEFPYNFYIYPGGDWYLRLIPRQKTPGGFELGTGIFINTQDPKETIAFIKEHFRSPNEEKIKKENQAEYERRV